MTKVYSTNNNNKKELCHYNLILFTKDLQELSRGQFWKILLFLNNACVYVERLTEAELSRDGRGIEVKKKLVGLKTNPKVHSKGTRFGKEYKEKLDFISSLLNFQDVHVSLM